MKQKLESILEKGKLIFLASLMILTTACASSKFYLKPKVGIITPISAKEQKYDSSATIGGAFGLSGKRVGLEASLDSFNSSAKYVETNSLWSKVNLNFRLAKPEAKICPYLIGGMNFLNESSKMSIPQFDIRDKITNNTTGLEFGIGTTIGGFDGKATYTMMLGSENVKNVMAFTIGYRISVGKKK